MSKPDLAYKSWFDKILFELKRAYIPKGFYLPMDFPLRKQCYLTISIILQTIAMKSDLSGENPFAPISGQTFRRAGVRDLSKVLKHLDDFVERVGNYIPNEKPYGYRLKITGDIEGIDLHKSIKISEDYLWQFQKYLTIDSARAHSWNETINRDRAHSASQQNRFNAYYMMIDKIANKCFRSSYDQRQHRRHTLLSNTKCELLQFVKLKREPLISIDYKCFQPLISTVLFQPWFYDKRSRINLWSINSKMDVKDKFHENELKILNEGLNEIYIGNKERYISTYDAQHCKKKSLHLVEDVFEYCNICYDARIYEHFAAIATKDHTRKTIKKPTLKWMYQRGKPRCTESADMRREFRTVTDVFDLYKSIKHHSYLPVLLTIIETTIMFDYVIPRLEKEHLMEPIDTKHDNVIAIKNEESIAKIMIEEGEKVLRVRPKVKIEHLWV